MYIREYRHEKTIPGASVKVQGSTPAGERPGSLITPVTPDFPLTNHLFSTSVLVIFH